MKNFRTALAIGVALTILFPINGCGGGGGGTGGSSGTQSPPLSLMSATGQVTLPTGFKESLTGMTVQSGVDTEPVASNGSFKVKVIGPGEVPVYLVNSSGNIILMGYADGGSSGSPEAGGKGQISALKTAEHLMFTGLSGPTVPPAYWSLLLSDILQTPQVTQLATTVSARVVANPTALGTGDSQLFAAAASACNGAAPGAPQQAAADRAKMAAIPQNQTFHVTVEAPPSSESGNQKLILVQPSAQQGGIDVLNSLVEPDTIQFQNSYRRRAAAFIYETATQVSGGDLTTVAPKVLPSSNLAPLVAEVSAGLDLTVVGSDLYEIPPANALNKFPAAILDLVEGNGAWTPKKTEPIELPLEPGTIRTDYTIVLVGPGNENAFIPFDDPTPPAMQQEWVDTLQCLDMEEAILDVIVPIIASRPFPGNPQWTNLTGPQLGEIVHVISAVPEMVADAENGEFKEAAALLIDEVSPAITQVVLTQLTTETFVEGTAVDLEVLQEQLESYFKAMDVANFIIQFFDATGVVVSSSMFNTYLSWTANVVTTGAKLSPQTATVNSENPSVLLTAGPGAVDDPKAPFYYEYSVSGAANGSLENSLGTSAKSPTLNTTSNQVQYLVNINAQDGEVDTVSVSVYQNAGTAASPVQGSLVGTAISRITVKLPVVSGPCGAFPSVFATGTRPPTVTVSPSTVGPGDTITIAVSSPGGQCSVNIGQNGTIILEDIRVNGALVEQGPSDGANINLPTTAGGGSATVTAVLTANQQSACPSVNAGETLSLAALGGPWVTASLNNSSVSNSGIESVPFAITSVATSSPKANPKR